MSTSSIQKAFETRLAAMSPDLSTAYENMAFTPANGTPYQKANLLPGAPDNSTIGQKHYIEVGVFQVTLMYPLGGGAKDARARAELTKTQFKRGTTMTQDGINIIVTRTPAIAPAFRSDDRYCIPVSITYQADISL